MSNKQICTRCEGEIADPTAVVRGRFGPMHEDGGVCVMYERSAQTKKLAARDVEIERLHTFEAAVRSWVDGGCWASGIPSVRDALAALDLARKLDPERS